MAGGVRVRRVRALAAAPAPLDRGLGRVSFRREGGLVARRWDDWAGRLLLRTAVLLHRWVAGRAATERLRARRNRVLRAAYRRGVPVEVLAAGLGLSPGWVRQVLNGRKPAEPPEVETAA